MSIRPTYLILLLLAATLGVYYPTLFAPFNSLDDQVFVQILLNQNHFSLSDHFNPGGSEHYFRPLLSLSFQIDKYLFGLEESLMHFFNILIHAMNALLVYALARQFEMFNKPGHAALPWVAAMVFALHPINTEAVNWILARTDLLAGTFVFASLLCLLKSLRQDSLFFGLCAAIFYFCGALCKETALFLLPGVGLIMVWQTAEPRYGSTKRWLVPGFYLLSVAGYFWLRFGAFATDVGLKNTSEFVAHASGAAPVGQNVAFTWIDVVTAALKATGFYAVKLFQPLPLNFAITKIHWSYIPVGIGVVIVLLLLCWRRRPVGVFFASSAGIGVSALLVLFTGLAWTPVAERYMYIPSGVFAIALTYGAYRFLQATSLTRVAAVVVFLLLGGAAWATAQRNIVWQDNLTLYQDTVRKSPEFAQAKNELAIALFAHGRDSEAKALIKGAKQPEKQNAALNIASLYIEEGDYRGARDILVTKLQDPGVIEKRVLEMLVRNASEMAERTDDPAEKRRYFEEKLKWLERLERISSDPFLKYRKARVYLLLDDREAAQKNFALAASGLPDGSPFKAPAAKLAKTLAGPEGP